MSILGVHSSGNQRSLLAGILITNDPLQRSEDDLCQLSMPVGPEVPSTLHAGNGPCADPLHNNHPPFLCEVTLSLPPLALGTKTVWQMSLEQSIVSTCQVQGKDCMNHC